MVKNKRLTVFIILSALLCASAVIGQNDSNDPENEDKSGLEFHAGETFVKTNDDGTFTKSYSDGVEAWTRDRDSELKADAAVYFSSLGETWFYGSAAFRDSTRHLNADTLIYNDNSEEVIAVGNVVVTEIDRAIWAERVSYNKKLRLINATGGVIVRDDSLRSSIKGMEAVFNDSTGYGLVIGTPVLVREDDNESVITITCDDTLKIEKEDKTIRLWNNVEILKDSLRATSGRAIYNDSTEVVILTENPQTWHVMYEIHGDAVSKLRADSYVTGDTIKVYLHERKVSGVDVVGNALSTTVWTDSTDAVYARSILESAKMNLTMKEDMISRITAVGTASSYYFRNPSYKDEIFLNEATGDTLSFYYVDGKISQLRISGKGGGGAKGKYYEFSPVDTTMVSESEVSKIEE